MTALFNNLETGAVVRETQVVGIDGGGSKTRAVLVSADARVLAEAFGGRSVLGAAPSAAACAELVAVVDSLCAQTGVLRDDVSFWGLGVNGVDFPDEHAAQVAAVCRHVGIPSRRTVLVNDGIGALWGATAGARAAIVQHGSGFTAAYRTALGNETLFDHLGCGQSFDIRRQVLPLVVRMIDGRREPTPLKEDILALLGVEDEQAFAPALYRRTLPLGRLRDAPGLIVEAWRRGDSAAEQLLTAAIEDYAVAAGAMLARMEPGPRPEVSFGGGMIMHWPAALWQRLVRRVRHLRPDADVHRPLLAPEYGDALMAAHRAGCDVPALFAGLQHARTSEPSEVSA
ncbi:MAG: hypothetical protein JXR37_17600 [Kiritimatiellae bacterium]|nr:hypothetical protein [Kiritimatiellia bacterium]